MKQPESLLSVGDMACSLDERTHRVENIIRSRNTPADGWALHLRGVWAAVMPIGFTPFNSVNGSQKEFSASCSQMLISLHSLLTWHESRTIPEPTSKPRSVR